jgi:hypothetical protein
MALAIKIEAGNDRNGNPRRGWIIADDNGSFINFINEGYSGAEALSAAGYANLPRTEAIDVLPATYKSAYRQSQSEKPSRRR